MCRMKNLLIFKSCFTIIFFLYLTLLLGNISLAHSKEVRGVTDRMIKIGVLGDLTGPAAEAWIQIATGIKAFSKMVNDKGGIHGRKIKYVLEDDRYTIPLALSCFKKLVYKDGILALLGASGVGHTGALIPLAEKAKLPMLAASGEKKLFIPARKYIFSGIPWYEDQSKLVIEYIFNDLKLKNPAIALMYPDTASGKDCRNAVRELVKVHPVRKYKEVVFSLTALDYTSEVLTLKRFKPDIVFIHGLVLDTSSIVKAAYRLKLVSQMIVDQYGCADEVMAIAGKAAEGLLAINCFGTWDDNSPGVNILREASLAYNPNVHRRSAYFFQGWIAGLVFWEAVKNAGRTLNTETYLKGLEAIRDFDTQGICGVISLGPNDHKFMDNHRFYKADTHKKRFVPISGWRKASE